MAVTSCRKQATVFTSSGRSGVNDIPTTDGGVAMTTMYSLCVWWQLHCQWQGSSLCLPSLHSAGEEEHIHTLIVDTTTTGADSEQYHFNMGEKYTHSIARENEERNAPLGAMAVSAVLLDMHI